MSARANTPFPSRRCGELKSEWRTEPSCRGGPCVLGPPQLAWRGSSGPLPLTLSPANLLLLRQQSRQPVAEFAESLSVLFDHPLRDGHGVPFLSKDTLASENSLKLRSIDPRRWARPRLPGKKVAGYRLIAT